jgi:hypothetical protein
MKPSHDVLRDACHAPGAKAVSSQLGISQALLYKWSQPPSDDGGSGTANPLDRVRQLYEATGDRALIDWLCHHANGFFVPNAPGFAPGDSLYPAINHLLQEFAATLGTIAKAGEDHRITPPEARLVRERWNHLKSVCEGFVLACEQGDYDSVQRTFRKTPPLPPAA